MCLATALNSSCASTDAISAWEECSTEKYSGADFSAMRKSTPWLRLFTVARHAADAIWNVHGHRPRVNHPLGRYILSEMGSCRKPWWSRSVSRFKDPPEHLGHSGKGPCRFL